MVRIPYIKIPSVRVGSIVPTSNIGTGGATPVPPTPITYLTQWKIVGNSEVHNNEIWSCGEYNATDGKWHILVQPQGGHIADIALTEPLRKVNDVADTIEFPATLEAFCNNDGSQIQTTLPDDTILHIRQIVKNGDFSNGTNSWNRTKYTSISASNNKLHIITNEAGETVNNYSWAGVNEAVKAEVAVDENVYIHYTANPNRNMNVGLDGTGGGVYAQECVQDIDNDISCVKKLTTVNVWYFGFNRGTHEVNDEVIISNVYSFDLDAMFADCPSLKPSTASEFEALFANINYIDYSDTTTNVIVKGGKLYKYVDTEGKALVTRNFASVDMGSLIWDMVEISSSGYFRFRTQGISSTAKGAPNNQSAPNALIAMYDAISADEVYYKNTGFAIGSTGILLGYDPDYNQSDSAAAFKTAMDGVELIYELATPTTELVDAPQIEEADSYTCVISQGGKAVEWSSFITNSE